MTHRPERPSLLVEAGGSILLAFAIVLVAALGSCAQAATYPVGQQITPRQTTGAYDAAYLDGNDAAPLVWGTCPNLQLFVGDTQSFNLRTLCSLSGTNAATATLARVSGTLPTGCSASTDGVSCTNAQASMGQTFTWQATDGVSSVTNTFSFVVVAPPVADTTGPTSPTACTFTPGTGSITVECDQSSDPYVGEPGSGVAWYRIYKNGALVASKAAPAANVQGALSPMTVGTADGTQSCTQTGASLAMSGGGAGLGTTADQFYGCGHQVVGDFIATSKVGAFAGAVTTGTAGRMVRVSSAAGSIYATCRGRDSDDKVNNRYRATTDASASNATLSPVVTFPVWTKLEVQGGAVSCSTSPDGLTFTANDTARPLSLGAQPYVLAFHASGTAGTTTTSAIDEVNIAPVARWSETVGTTGTGSWTVRAEDADGNLSAATTAVTATPEGGAACTGGSFTPLHYDDFEGASIDSSKTPTAAQRWKIQDDYDTTLDTAPAHSTLRADAKPDWSAVPSTKSVRVQLSYTKNAGANYSRNGGSSTSESGHRNELIQKSWSATSFSSQNYTLGNEYWTSFSIFLPAAGDANGDPEWIARPYPHYEILYQLHDSPDNATRCGTAEPSRNPMLVISVDSPKSTPPTVARTRWTISSRATDVACQTSLTYQFNRTWQFDDYTDERGQWVRFTIRYKPSFGADGILQIWKNGVELTGPATTGSGSLPLFGPNTYNDTLGPYALPIGIYAQPYDPVAADGTTLNTTPSSGSCGGFSPCLPARRVMYLDNWMFGRVTGNPTTAVGTDNVGYRSVTTGASACP